MRSSQTPKHWEILSECDKIVYAELRSALEAPTSKNKRNTRIQDFKSILEAIDIFENRVGEDKWKRCYVCGVVSFKDGIAVNITQLRNLVPKCKTSINGCLKELGYGRIDTSKERFREIISTIPIIQKSPQEMRQWTVRLRGSAPPSEKNASEGGDDGDSTIFTSNFSDDCASLTNWDLSPFGGSDDDFMGM